MALNIFPFRANDDICEVLLVEKSGEDPQHVVLMVVPFQAVLLLAQTHLDTSVLLLIQCVFD